MPVNPAFNMRSGGNRFLLLAQTMCRLTNAAAPAIRARYADRPALLAALTAAQSLCELLPAALNEQIVMDAADLPAFDPADSVIIPGQQG